MKRTLSILLTLALILSASLSSAEAETIRPLEITPDTYDPDNGKFWVCMDAADSSGGGSITMDLYLEDRYSLAEIENLRRGDTIEVRGETYTIEIVIIHGWYDKDGDGEFDTGSITVKDPGQAGDLLDKYKLQVSEQELFPFSYEIYTLEEFDGYIAFTVGQDGFCHPLVNDDSFRTFIGSVEVPLPLPEDFTCHIVYEFGNSDDVENGTARDFLDAAAYGCDCYSDIVRFEDGNLAEAWLSR